MIKSNLHYLFHEFIKQDSLYSDYEFVIQSQYYSSDKLKEYQESKLTELLIHASKHVPYYQNLFKDIGFSFEKNNIISEFKKLPILKKEDIRNNFNNIKSNGLESKRFRKNSTSGSTGSNLMFYSDNSALIRNALEMRNNDWINKNKSDLEIIIWGASWDVKKATKIKSRIKSYLKSKFVLPGYKLSDESFKNYTKLINTKKPYLLTSYPSILYEYARYLQRTNQSLCIKAIKSAGEKLHTFQREFIEKILGVKIYDFYGARDIPMIAMQCPKNEHLHILEENVYAEILDDEGNILNEGEGDLIVTDLHNYVFPFIRYAIGDRVKLINQKCSCGRNHRIIKEVLGRTFEIIEFPNGNRVGGTFWTLVMRSIPDIIDFQVIQNSEDRIEIELSSNREIHELNINQLRKNILNYSGENLSLSFKIIDNHNINKAGKREFVRKL